jgi:predicted PurR-regulated permease PerM
MGPTLEGVVPEMDRSSQARRTDVDGHLVDNEGGHESGNEHNGHGALAEAGHNDGFAQPHDVDSEGLVAAAEATAALISTEAEPMGRPGKPWDRRAPFWIGMAGAAGVAVTVGLVAVLITISSVLVLIGLAFFIAVGLEPAVSWLVRHRFPRWAAVIAVVVIGFVLVGGFFAIAIPVLITQGSQLVKQLPGYLQTVQDHNSVLGQLNDQFHIQQDLTQALNGASVSTLAGGVLGVGVVVFSAIGSTLVVVVLTLYLLADLPRVRAGLYRLAPDSRRPRVILIGDEIFAKVGAYVLGNLAISVIAGTATLIWLLAFGVPYAFLLALFVALLDLIPVVGSAIGGLGATLVALTVSPLAALLTAAFFVLYRVVEDYLLVPRVIGRVVKVPDLLTVVAVLLGAALLGVIGALVAIPLAAALMLVLREVITPSLDRA